MAIARDVNGLADYWVGMIESVDERDDIDIEKKINLAKKASQEVREMLKLNMAYKSLMLKAPDLAKNEKIVLPVGTPVRKLDKKSAA